MEALKEIGGTVFYNQSEQIRIVGSDGRIYVWTYHKKATCGTFPEGLVVRIYYEERGHNDISVKTIEEWDSPSYFVEEEEDLDK